MSSPHHSSPARPVTVIQGRGQAPGGGSSLPRDLGEVDAMYSHVRVYVAGIDPFHVGRKFQREYSIFPRWYGVATIGPEKQTREFLRGRQRLAYSSSSGLPCSYNVHPSIGGALEILSIKQE
jgi:hypothetical protein